MQQHSITGLGGGRTLAEEQDRYGAAARDFYILFDQLLRCQVPIIV